MHSVDSPFAGKRVLLLQGPVGPFFNNLAQDLRRAGAQVFKFNFNAGDWLFYPRNAQSFKGALADWVPAFKDFVTQQKIDAVLLFGDCRPMHAEVRSLGQSMGFAVGVFEEGYLRPDHVTFEPIGVNGHSQFQAALDEWSDQQVAAAGLMDASAAASADMSHQKTASHQKVGNTYWYAACWGMLYFLASWLGQACWNNKLHHRRLSVMDAPWWWLSYGRKAWYRWTERGVQERLTGPLRQRFFLVPLQVHNDAQITVHSDYESVCSFVDRVMRSFAGALRQEISVQGDQPDGVAALGENLLVFKHHPMDRGHRNYARALRLLAQRHGLEKHVLYIHDQHLPSLLKACKGVVLVNSTTGLSALGHGAPVKVCGRALYDLPGLTFQGTLADFWWAAPASKPDPLLLRQFRKTLLEKTQLNGSFYRKLEQAPWQCGVWLEGQMAHRLWPMKKLDPAKVPRAISRAETEAMTPEVMS